MCNATIEGGSRINGGGTTGGILPGQITGPAGPGGSSGGSSGSACQITCLNGGTCINNKCACKSGFSGEFCGERKSIFYLQRMKMSIEKVYCEIFIISCVS